MSLPTGLAVAMRIAVLVGAWWITSHVESAVFAWPSMLVVLSGVMPLLRTEVSDEDRMVLREAAEWACAQTNLSMKQLAAHIGLNPADLCNALAGLRKCDLFWRFSTLAPLEWRQCFVFRLSMAWGLPTTVRHALKMSAAFAEVERSA